ncbi:MAG: hypothetical protein WC610_01545 [Patescibacteria group bacterium]
MAIKIKFSAINNWLERNKIAAFLLLFLICFVYFSWIQDSPYFRDPDSFYHIKMAQLINEKGIVYDFPYLNFTILKDGYIDHHFLYHLYLAPFVRWLPPIVGAKFAHIILDSLVIITFFFLLNRLKVKGAFWYNFLLLFSESFMFRLGLIKAQPLSLIIVFLSVFFIMRQKYWPLFFLAFIYVWTYDGWFLLLILAVVHMLVNSFDSALLGGDNFINKMKICFSSRRQRVKLVLVKFFKVLISKNNLKLFSSVFFGLVLGVIVNPYFPKNLGFYWIHIVQIGLLNFQNKIGVGAEWYPYDAFKFIQNTYLPLILVIGALILFFSYYKSFKVVVKYIFFLFILFLIATIKARRNIEYLVPFMVIFSALVYSGVMEFKKARTELKHLKEILGKILFSNRWIQLFITAILVSVFIVLAYYLPLKSKDNLSQGLHYNYLKNASDFLLKNSNQGDLVFNSDWDIFPELFYHNSQNYYIVGLDATFMYLYDKGLYQKWWDITLGKRSDEAYLIIKNDFKAKYVLVTPAHKEMIEMLNNNFHFLKVYGDDDAIIYKVL